MVQRGACQKKTQTSRDAAGPGSILAPGAGGDVDAVPEEMSRKSQSTTAAHAPGERTPRLRGRRRSRARRRLRYLRQLRELQLRDTGGFVFDLYRFGERRDELVRSKLEALLATDREIRTLEGLLGITDSVQEIRQPGVGGTCAECGAFHASDARFCASCGADLKAQAAEPVAEPATADAEPVPEAEPEAEAEPESEPGAEPEPEADGVPELDGDVTIVRQAAEPAPANGASANGHGSVQADVEPEPAAAGGRWRRGRRQ